MDAPAALDVSNPGEELDGGWAGATMTASKDPTKKKPKEAQQDEVH